MRAALLQIASPDVEPMRERIERVGELVASLEAVDLIVMPELWAPGYFDFERYQMHAEPIEGSIVHAGSSWARATGAHVHVGSVLELGTGGRMHNTAVLIAPDGAVALTYRKMHVFGYQSLEAKLLAPGDRIDVAQTNLGVIGMSTCYDLRFPELYRCLVNLGAQFVIVPAAWPAARLEHWRLLTRARALENEFYLLGCGSAGTQQGIPLSGHSVVVDPWGRTLAEAGDGEEVLYADCDVDVVTATRAEFPVLKDRRIAADLALDASKDE